MSNSEALEETIIRPPSSLDQVDLNECFRYRHMLWSLIVRNLKTEYNDLRLGIIWVIIRPIINVSVWVSFRHLSSARTAETIPYMVYVYSGLVFWFYLSDSITQTARSIRADSGIMSKVYYPRVISPLAPCLANLLELAVAALPLVPLTWYFGVHTTWRMILLAPIILGTIFFAMGLGCIFAALSLKRRDFEKTMQIVLWLSYFVSPTIYAPQMLPGGGKWMLLINPIAGLQMLFRSCLFREIEVSWMVWITTPLWAFAFLWLGLRMYQHAERQIVDNL